VKESQEFSHRPWLGFEEFGIEKFNRQVGAMMSTVGRAKIDVISNFLADINPQVETQ
jgi:tRNA A37 threonylcarbamoyladenosine dehydratase